MLLYDAHREHPLNTYCLPGQDEDSDVPSTSAFRCIDENVLIAGDDSGGIHLFDMRTDHGPVASVLEQGDYISAICPVDKFGTKALLAASGDGTLCAYDMRVPPMPRLRLQYASDSFNDDLLSLAVLDPAPYAIAGTLSGALNIYNLRFLDTDCVSESAQHVDRFYGHPECVNSVISFGNDGVILTASSDGIIRVVDVLDKILVGVLPYEYDQDVPDPDSDDTQQERTIRPVKKKKPSWPVEAMVSLQGVPKPRFALLGHDNFIRFCDGSTLVDEEDEVEEDTDAIEEHAAKVRSNEQQLGEAKEEFEVSRRKKKRKGVSKEKSTMPKDFFDGL